MLPGAGAKIARTAGSSLRLISVDGDEASSNFHSGEIRLVKSRCPQQLVQLEMAVIKKQPLVSW